MKHLRAQGWLSKPPPTSPTSPLLSTGKYQALICIFHRMTQTEPQLLVTDLSLSSANAGERRSYPSVGSNMFFLLQAGVCLITSQLSANPDRPPNPPSAARYRSPRSRPIWEGGDAQSQDSSFTSAVLRWRGPIKELHAAAGGRTR